MAKLTALEALNEVLRNCGESTVSDLASLSGFQLLAWYKLTDAIQDICTDQDTRLDFLEAEGEVPMATDEYKYEIASLASGSDLMKEDRESFRCPDNSSEVAYITPQEFDKRNKGHLTQIGYRDKYTKYAGYFVFDG